MTKPGLTSVDLEALPLHDSPSRAGSLAMGGAPGPDPLDVELPRTTEAYHTEGGGNIVMPSPIGESATAVPRIKLTLHVCRRDDGLDGAAAGHL